MMGPCNQLPMLNALSVDVEDYYHVTAFERWITRRQWGSMPSRVVENTRRVLDLLDEAGAKATFFVLGWVGRRHPRLVREIRGRGHHVASHSYWHRLVYQLSPREFRTDLRDSRAVLEDALGERIDTYRAPSFSIARQSLWALDVLAEEGFRIDSSVFPVWHDRYGVPSAPRDVHELRLAGGSLWEFPLSVVRILRQNLPVSGGGYFRLYPWHVTSSALHHINRGGRPFVFYFHPWEIDPLQPRITAPWRSRWRHYVNLETTERKLKLLLRTFRFGRVSDVIHQYVHESSAAHAPRALPAG
jgi:polysaccharide deacetylase family protein (PEP-CTERM system associated)